MPQAGSRALVLGMLAALAAAPSVASAATAVAAGAPLDTSDLASGPYASMHAELKRSIFRIDVLKIDLRFDPFTRNRLAAIAQQAPSLKSASDELASAACQAQNAWARLSFEHDVPLQAFISTMTKELERCRRDGAISDADYRGLVTQLPRWFDSVAGRGFRDGDVLLHRVRPDSLRTVLLGADGRVLLDYTMRGAHSRRALLAGYLAPRGSSLRERLIKSLGT
jgi:hypothetical protein